jgi:predicted metalloprotease
VLVVNRELAATYAALPDGSMPLYGTHPLPGMPEGGPPLPPLGWGPDLREDTDLREEEVTHHGAAKRRIGFVAALLMLAGAAGLIVTAAVRADASGAPQASSQAPQIRPAGGSGVAPTITDAALYSAGPEASVACREPDVTLGTEDGVRVYYTNVVSCLNKTWASKLRSAPKIVFWGGRERSPCSIGSAVAFYCTTNQTLYLQADDVIKAWNTSADSARRASIQLWVTDTIAREYAHHIQQVTGILATVQKLAYDAPGELTRAELSRRAQLQATCLGAAFIGANKLTYGIVGLDLPMYNRYILAQPGDENTGTPDGRQYWAARGFGMTDPAYCDTFKALPIMVK